MISTQKYKAYFLLEKAGAITKLGG